MGSELPARWPDIHWSATLIFLAALSCGAAERRPHLQDLNKALMQAAKKGDYLAAEAALEKGADPNARVFGTWLPARQGLGRSDRETADRR